MNSIQEKIIMSSEKRCPEGIRKLREENTDRLFIYGSKYTEKIKKELDEWNISVNGIGIIETEDYAEADIRNQSDGISIIVGFQWSTNSDLLRTLCEDDFIRNIYIMEGAEYAWTLMFSPEIPLFKHSKMIFIDSYYRGLLARGLDYRYFKDYQEQFEEAYGMLEDDWSRQTFIRYLDGHINLTTFPMESVKDHAPQYFAEKVIQILPSENQTKGAVFVDCGAYDGDTILEFNKQTSGKYEHIYAFEPDLKMFKSLEDNTKGLKNINLFPIGTYHEKGSVGFDNEGCGTISDSHGNSCINVDRLDHLIEDKVTFIKIDVEGAELETLKGAEGLIQKYHPQIAVCVYHKAEDLITLPQYLKSLVPEYKFYLRAYFDYCSEVVLYAVI